MQNVYPPPPKGKILLLSLTLSQLLQGANITFTPTSNDRGEIKGNQGDAYAITKYETQNGQIASYLTITENQEIATQASKTHISENSNIVLKNSIVSNTTSGLESSHSASWDRGFSELEYGVNSYYSPNHIVIDTPTSTITLETSSIDSSACLGEENAIFDIKAKTIYVGSGNSTFDESASINVLRMDSKIQGDVIIQKDGGLTIGNIRDEETQKDSLTHFTLEGNLTINGGTLRVAAMGGGENPTFDVNGKVEIRNATLQTFVKTNGLIENVRMVKGRDGLNLEGTNVMQTSVSYYLQDFVEIGKDHIDYNSATQAQVDLYEYILEVKDNTLYANPRLSEIANQKNVFDLINDAKNQVAIMFYQRAKEGIDQVNKNIQMCERVVNGYGNCSEEGKAAMQKQLQDYQASLDGLRAYLQKQVDEGYIEAPFPYTLLASTPKSSSTTPTTTGFDNIDSKLSIIKDGANNSLAESIKNSNNNLLAVNFVNTMMQGYNNTPIELLNEVKSNLSMSASISSFLRNDLHTSLALASRFASFSFAPKVSQANSLQTQAFLDNDLDPKESVSSFSPNLSNSLWANAFGGANLLGSEVGASYGLNLGYDKNLENALIGTYLSYEYATLKPSLLTLNAHNIKLGVYSRIQEGGNEIDVELSSLLSIISQESATKALDSLSTANYLSSLTELKTTYGYAFLEGDFKLKPLIGLALSFSYTPGFKEEGDIIKDFSSFNNFNTSLQAGLEFRANFSNKGFLYTLLSIEQDLYNSLDSLSINSQSLPITQDLKTYAQVLLGGEIAISKDWNIALSLGAKQSIIGAKDASGAFIFGPRTLYD